ncbi:hypothetical protein DV515_00007210 [Chloebia gouldiae]|uniref:Uncharacterized protein n=1 Tax=Chloebia gouldiae TaxID=44316 RepID=A0A3L8SJR5_CHLGU|nr:hypothetical protein DV515_00007210 [Chloebia gouldiae]
MVVLGSVQLSPGKATVERSRSSRREGLHPLPQPLCPAGTEFRGLQPRAPNDVIAFPAALTSLTARVWCGEEKENTGFPAPQPPDRAADAGRIPALREHVEVRRGGAGIAEKSGGK